jgi:uncharacterized secreted protein with C-terminal beta-propeller domain
MAGVSVSETVSAQAADTAMKKQRMKQANVFIRGIDNFEKPPHNVK